MGMRLHGVWLLVYLVLNVGKESRGCMVFSAYLVAERRFFKTHWAHNGRRNFRIIGVGAGRGGGRGRGGGGGGNRSGWVK